jgi:hypothetical protein
MATSWNASSNGHVSPGPARRFRVDGQGRQTSSPSGPSRNGRRFAIAAAIGLLAGWGTLGLIFRDWRIQHERLASYGEHDVATLVEPLKRLHPPEMDYGQWVDAVDDTRLMLVRLTASGMFDQPGIVQLHDEVQRRVAGATSDTAQSSLAKLWDDLEHKAGPVLLRQNLRGPHPLFRPELLGPSNPNLTDRRVWSGLED